MRTLKYFLLVAAVALSLLMFMLSLDPERYFYYTEEERSLWEWHWSVLLLVALPPLEALGLYYLFRAAAAHQLLRSLLFGGALVVWFMLNIQIFMHQPEFYYYHIWWLFVIAGISVLVVFYAVFISIRTRLHDA